MTIGIAASGPRAGLAVFRALAAVERVAEGAIRGYAVFAAIDAGDVHRAATQRGGSRTLFVDGERTGVEPPPGVAAAPIAAIMSSGPDRPEPLEQFLPARAGVGLVTGHRLPNALALGGQPLNLAVLERLAAGCDARAAVEDVLAADPEADAGVIAIDANGRIHGANSARVGRRPDLGHARRVSADGTAAVEVLHNAIHPVVPLAELAAWIALETMCPPFITADHVTVTAGTPITVGDAARVLVDATGHAQRVETTDGRIVTGRHNCAAVYLGAEVVHDGVCLGRTVAEPNVVVEDGRIVALSGQSSVRIPYQAEPADRHRGAE